MVNIEIIGFAAAIIMSISLTPQVIKSWKTKSTKDISFLWTLIYLLGLTLWLIYGLGINSWPLVLAAILETILALTLITLKIKYG